MGWRGRAGSHSNKGKGKETILIDEKTKELADMERELGNSET